MRITRPINYLALACALAATEVSAQELEPRTYSNVPTGMNFLIAGYAYTHGGVAADPSVPLDNPDIRTQNAVLAYARSLDVWGTSAKFDVMLPYTWLSGTAEFVGQPVVRDVSGFGDPRFRFAVNFIGAPAMSLTEYAAYKQDLIVGASLSVTAPLGQYDPSKAVNIGTNRWSIAPELGVSKAWGPWTFELIASGTWYTDNTDFYGGQTRAEEPIYSAQLHLLYNFRSGVWLALSSNYYTGGLSSLNGVPGNDLQANSRMGATVAIPVDRYNSIKLNVSSGVSVRTGTDFDAIGIFWQHRWGAGL
jgi:hypothetical protein